MNRYQLTKIGMLIFVIGFLTPFIMGSNDAGCTSGPPTADQVEQSTQERILKEGTSQIGMPAITEFREKKFMKELLERRDKGIVTYTYVYSDTFACFTFVGDTIGFPLPYATQFTNPQKAAKACADGVGCSWHVMAQADPNGLFSPNSADATWSLMKDPNPGSKAFGPVYSEPHLFSSSFKLPEKLECTSTMQNFADMLAKALKK